MHRLAPDGLLELCLPGEQPRVRATGDGRGLDLADRGAQRDEIGGELLVVRRPDRSQTQRARAPALGHAEQLPGTRTLDRKPLAERREILAEPRGARAELRCTERRTVLVEQAQTANYVSAARGRIAVEACDLSLDEALLNERGNATAAANSACERKIASPQDGRSGLRSAARGEHARGPRLAEPSSRLEDTRGSQRTAACCTMIAGNELRAGDQARGLGCPDRSMLRA